MLCMHEISSRRALSYLPCISAVDYNLSVLYLWSTSFLRYKVSRFLGQIGMICAVLTPFLILFIYGLPGMTQLTRKSPIALRLILRGSPGLTA